MRELVRQVARGVSGLLHRPYAVFGHSMGGLIAYELARYLDHRLGRPPVALIVSGRGAPDFRLRQELFHTLPDDRLIDELRAFDGTPDEVLRNRELMEVFLPVIRADLELIETYHHDPVPTLSCPIHVFVGDADDQTPPGSVDRWEQCTTAAVRVRTLPGGHFFPQRTPDPFFDALCKALTRAHQEIAHDRC